MSFKIGFSTSRRSILAYSSPRHLGHRRVLVDRRRLRAALQTTSTTSTTSSSGQSSSQTGTGSQSSSSGSSVQCPNMGSNAGNGNAPAADGAVLGVGLASGRPKRRLSLRRFLSQGRGFGIGRWLVRLRAVRLPGRSATSSSGASSRPSLSGGLPARPCTSGRTFAPPSRRRSPTPSRRSRPGSP